VQDENRAAASAPAELPPTPKPSRP
jgi:hypothetical protein